jgi:hypothetical protein
MSALEASIPVHHSQIDAGWQELSFVAYGDGPPGPPVATSKLLEFYISQIIPLRGDEPAVRANQHVVDLVNFVRERSGKPLNEMEAELKAPGTSMAWIVPKSTDGSNQSRYTTHLYGKRHDASLTKTKLSEHLSLDQPNRIVWIFAHANFLCSCPKDGPR